MRVDSGHVARTYGDSYFKGIGAGYPSYVEEGALLRERGEWYARLLAAHATPGCALEVGCAAGFWLKGLVDHGWRGVGLEPNPPMADFARSTLGLDVRTATLERFETAERFDLIAMMQVVAHFGDVRRALESASRLLRPSGLLIVETWDRNSRSARLLGRSWHEYNPPSVLHWFSKASLDRLAAECSFTRIAGGRPRRRIRGDHAKAVVRHKLKGTRLGAVVEPALRLVPDALALRYPLDDLFWVLYRF